MKKYILLILVITTFPVNCQLIHDKLGDIVPYSQCEKYKDSLFCNANGGRSIYETGESFAAGFNMDQL